MQPCGAAQRLDRRLGHQHGRLEIDRDLAVEVGDRELLDRAVGRETAGHVDHHVEPSEVAQRHLDRERGDVRAG